MKQYIISDGIPYFLSDNTIIKDKKIYSLDETKYDEISQYNSNDLYCDNNGSIKVKEKVLTRQKIQEIKNRLIELNNDLVQDLAGEVVPNIEERKAEFINIHNELRVLLGKETRELKEK